MDYSYYTANHQTIETSALLQLLQAKGKGELYFEKDGTTYQIHYELSTATLELSSVSGSVTNLYNEQDPLFKMCQPVLETMLLLAKINLLNQLYAIGDKNICDVIDGNHELVEGKINPKNLTNADIDGTLAKILTIKFVVDKNAQVIPDAETQFVPVTKKITMFGPKSTPPPKSNGELVQGLLDEKAKKIRLNPQSIQSLKDLEDLTKTIKTKYLVTREQETSVRP